MNLDIPLAGWLLSVVAFFLGTITPFIYRRFFHEGISIQQAYEVISTTQTDVEQQRSEVTFSTIVKFANARKESALLDRIEAPSIKSQGLEFQLVKVELKAHEANSRVYLPPSTAPNATPDYLPLIIKPDEERILAVGIRFRYYPKDISAPWDRLSEYIQRNGLKVSFRVNGKYRNYVLQIKDPLG